MFLPSPPRCWDYKCAPGLCRAGDQIQGLLGKCSLAKFHRAWGKVTDKLFKDPDCNPVLFSQPTMNCPAAVWIRCPSASGSPCLNQSQFRHLAQWYANQPFIALIKYLTKTTHFWKISLFPWLVKPRKAQTPWWKDTHPRVARKQRVKGGSGKGYSLSKHTRAHPGWSDSSNSLLSDSLK